MAWAKFLASAAAPWAAPVVAGVEILIKAAKLNPAWNPKIPLPPRSKKDGATESEVESSILTLEESMLRDPPPGMDREGVSELLGYAVIRRFYPYLHASWIPPRPNGPTLLAPFIEIWSNTSAGAERLPVRFDLAEERRFRAPAVSAVLGSLIDREAAKKLLRDEPKLRIVDAVPRSAGLVVKYAFCLYSDYLRTNWAIANLPYEDAKVLRGELCGMERLRDLDESKCANHLGVSAVAVFDDEIILPVSSSKVISSPNMLIPSVSGSADFLPDYWTESPAPGRDILREAQEELGLETVFFKDVRPRFLALTRNVLRGGKPEAFYCFQIPQGNPSTKPSFELRSDPFIRLPALLDSNEDPVTGFERHLEEVESFIQKRSRPELIISPYTRVALYYYLKFSKARWAQATRR